MPVIRQVNPDVRRYLGTEFEREFLVERRCSYVNMLLARPFKIQDPTLRSP